MASWRTRTRRVGLIALALLAVGCHKREKPGVTTTTAAREPAAKVASAPEDEKKRVPTDLVEGPPPLLTPVIKFLPVDGLRGPAAVIHDEASDAYLVSNVDGRPTAVDGNGFISKLSPDGKKILRRWIEGGKNNVILNAPKGMALRGNELWVTDIDTVRIFHRVAGAPLGEIQVPGTKYLTDAALGPDGCILVSDVGLKARDDGSGFEESGSDSVYAIYKDRQSTNIVLVAKNYVAGPSALLPTDKKLWAVSRGGELFSIDLQGKREDIQKLPAGDLGGLVPLGDELLVSSRAANAIYRGTLRGNWWVAIGDLKSPGNLTYDRKRGRVIVPLSSEDEVRVYDLE